MSTPSLQERQNFWVWAYARHSFRNALAGCDFIAKPLVPLSKPFRRIIVTGVITTYARPFTRCCGIQKLPQNIIPKHRLKIHESILDQRNKEMAHVDASDYQADNPLIGNINQVRIRIKRDETSFSVTMTEPPWADFRPLIAELHEKAIYHTEKFRDKYIDNQGLAIGEYLLNILPASPTPFLKAPQPPFPD
jgi:hypothetical protein